MLRIRLRRMGSRHRPFYRVVVGDSRRTPLASALEEIGYYDPRKKPAILHLDVARADHWVSQGAQPSETVEKLIAKARAAPEAAAPSAEAEAEVAAEAEAEAAAEVKAEAAAETEAEAAPPAEVEAEAEAAPPAEVEAEADATPEAEAEAEEKT